MSERKYFSMTGKEISLLALIREKPKWAKTHINELEAQLKARRGEVWREAVNRIEYVSSGIDMEEHLKTCPHLEPQEQGK